MAKNEPDDAAQEQKSEDTGHILITFDIVLWVRDNQIED